MLEQHEVAAYLLKRRLVSRRSVVSGALRITDASSRNRNFRVTDGAGESLLVKQGIAADSAHSLANEVALYRRLTAGDGATGALAGCVPRLHGHDALRGILILEWIADGEDLDALHHRRGRPSPILAAALGRSLAAVHAVSRDAQALRDDAPWVLALHRPPLEALRYLSAASIELIRLLQADADLGTALDALRGDWRTERLVHRDVKWANCIAHPAAGGTRLTRVKLVDWEMAGWGDPAFDIGSALSDFAGFALRGGTSAAPRSFWRAYVRVQGLDEPAAATLLARSVRFAGARLVQSAYEHTQETTVMSALVVRLVELARELLLEPSAAGAARLGIGP
ncbi:MAG TPA: phosphotransferase [Solirubrobacteraceae bacterium]|nr:phosphotransferase [Solirubrobacteraceae bacterium]